MYYNEKCIFIIIIFIFVFIKIIYMWNVITIQEMREIRKREANEFDTQLFS